MNLFKNIKLNKSILIKLLIISIITLISICIKLLYDSQYYYDNIFPEKNKIYTLDYYFYYGKYKYKYDNKFVFNPDKRYSDIIKDSTDFNIDILKTYNLNYDRPSSYFELNNLHYSNINPYSIGYTNKIYIVDIKNDWVRFKLIKDNIKDNQHYFLKKYKLYKLLK